MALGVLAMFLRNCVKFYPIKDTAFEYMERVKRNAIYEVFVGKNEKKNEEKNEEIKDKIKDKIKEESKEEIKENNIKE